MAWRSVQSEAPRRSPCWVVAMAVLGLLAPMLAPLVHRHAGAHDGVAAAATPAVTPALTCAAAPAATCPVTAASATRPPPSPDRAPAPPATPDDSCPLCHLIAAARNATLAPETGGVVVSAPLVTFGIARSLPHRSLKAPAAARPRGPPPAA